MRTRASAASIRKQTHIEAYSVRPEQFSDPLNNQVADRALHSTIEALTCSGSTYSNGDQYMIEISSVLSNDEYEILRRVARRIAGDPHQADDLAQESWFLAHAKGRTVARDLPWIIGAMKMIHRQNARSESRRLVREEVVALEKAESTSSLDGRLRTTDENQVDFARVEAAMNRLATSQASAIRQRFLEDRSCRSIALDSGVSVQTIRTRIRRGMTRMRADFGSEIQAQLN